MIINKHFLVIKLYTETVADGGIRFLTKASIVLTTKRDPGPNSEIHSFPNRKYIEFLLAFRRRKPVLLINM